MMPLTDDVTALKAELEFFKSQHSKQKALIDTKLTEFSERLEAISNQLNASETEDAFSEIEQFTTDFAASPLYWQVINQQSQSDDAIASYESDSWERDSHNNLDPSPVVSRAKKPPSAASKMVSRLVNQFSDAIEHGVAALLGPFGSLGQQGKDFYQHYQAKGLGPVFLMTLAGIVTLTLGFGYLLQYSINHWFTELGKALFGLGTASVIIGVGIFIHRKRPGMEGFGSGLVGLGLILNYLCLYFLGPYFNLIPESVCFGLLLVNTILGYGLSFKLDTKIVAVIALIGGSLAPLMLLDGSNMPLLYLPYLLLVGCCSLVQSYKLSWPMLMEVTALLHIGCIQYLSQYLYLPFTDLSGQSLLAIATVNILFYVYSVASVLVLVKSVYSPRLLMLPVAILVFTIYSLSEMTLFAGELLIINALICGLLYAFLNNDKQFKGLVLAFAGSFAGFGALSLISPEFLGLVLLLEGLLLLWLGCKEAYFAIRIEAYVLLAVGLFSSFNGLIEGLGRPYGVDVSFMDYQGLLSITMVLSCVFLFGGTQLLSKFNHSLTATDKYITRVLLNVLHFSVAITLVLISYFISDDYFLNTLPLVSLLLLFLGAKHKLKMTEVMAWLWLVPLMGLIVVGIIDTQSMRFALQALNVKLAWVELFLSLMLAYYWYKKYYADSVLVKAAYYIQVACFIAIPLLFLPKVVRHYPEFIAVALWLSTFISLGLTYIHKHKSIVMEAKILCILAVMTTASSCLADLWQGLLALAIGGLFMAGLLFKQRQLPDAWQVKTALMWHISPYYLALVLAVVSQIAIGFIEPTWGITGVLLAAYFVMLVEHKGPLAKWLTPALRPSYSLGYMAIFVCAFIPMLEHAETRLALDIHNLLLGVAEVGLLWLLASYFTTGSVAVKVHKKALPLKALVWGWHILLGVCYMQWSYLFADTIAAPVSAVLMVIHGSVLMFISLRPKQAEIIKLAGVLFALTFIKVIFVDMASFEIVQKVVAFMLIGIILLAVAYFYQKTKNRLVAVS